MDIQLDELMRTREQLHQASQLVSAVPRSFLNYDVSDSNASLIWDSDHRALVSEKIKIDGSAYQSGLIISDFSLRAPLKTLFGLSESRKCPIKAGVLQHSPTMVKVVQR